MAASQNRLLRVTFQSCGGVGSLFPVDARSAFEQLRTETPRLQARVVPGRSAQRGPEPSSQPIRQNSGNQAHFRIFLAAG